MRRYDDPIEVRRGLVKGTEAPEQFLWRGRLWLVHDVVAHWVETGAWWEQDQAADRLGDMVGEREVWRVDAASGRAGFRAGVVSGQRGVFDLVFDWSAGVWQLQRSID
ncbi:MAG TPA: DUF6504 family protein [Nocardioidaceae bacterium]|jgi:hypothetical protein|nr:DUF6504 family protein [Actinomycetota bacterium]MDQ3422721.1 DUF6504 family protein [Actinomycetota bacterium]HEV8055576.1 DUF6504 family protein [Nocardioidaceae bacterium]